MSEPLRYPKRLIEVDLPIKRISAHARREKSIRHGHISTLHIWWARRPLAACRSVILASLWPDPVDGLCPQRFRDEAAAQLSALRDKRGGTERDWKNPEELRQGLLDFIADFANWDLANDRNFLEVSQRLVQAAHESLGGESGTRPLVFDPFAGGGSIPLEALRVGADSFASDLNPIAVLINKVLLEYIPKYGKRLVEDLQVLGERVKIEAAKELSQLYPKSSNGSEPIAYLWARTARCEGPGCGVEVPLIRSLCVANRGKNSIALEIQADRKKQKIEIGIVTGIKRDEISAGTVKRSAAICPLCGHTTPAANVRGQFEKRRGGTEDARLMAVVTLEGGEKSYRLPTHQDLAAIRKARERLAALGAGEVPNEPLPYLRSIFNIKLLGVEEWGDLFSPRQRVQLATFIRCLRKVGESITDQESGYRDAVLTILAFAIDKMADVNSSLSQWISVGEKIGHTFGRQALGIIWDYAEFNPFADISGSWDRCLGYIAEVIEAGISLPRSGQAVLASAAAHPMPSDSATLMCTDPPYYDIVPYADLSDFFYVWLKRTIGHIHAASFGEQLSPKKQEIVQLAERNPVYSYKTRENYEKQMRLAMSEGRRVVDPSGLGVVVFAHKGTTAWETQLQAMIDAGWVVVGSWPIDTEREGRLRAMKSATLTSSIHLVCRPRENPDGSERLDDIGDFRSILAELPKRIHQWMPRLAEEGVVGADAIFACLGPALEIFSRYSRVEKANGDAVSLREYLEHIWAAVSKEALSMIFRDAETLGLEEDARITAMWLWTLAAPGNSDPSEGADEDDADDQDDDDDDEGKPSKAKVAGYLLEYDAARKIAQGLGARLEALTHVVEVKRDKARLLPVTERAQHLFGKPEGAAAAAKRAAKKKQMSLFTEAAAEKESAGWGDLGEPTGASTVLDRVHQSMLLFASGRAEALKRFLVDDGVGRQAQFWKLAQSLSALYPSGSEEKRWVDGVLARKKGLGF